MLQSTEVIEPALDFFLRQFFGKAFFDGGNNRSEIIWILPEIIAHRNDREKVSGGFRREIIPKVYRHRQIYGIFLRPFCIWAWIALEQHTAKKYAGCGAVFVGFL